VGSFLIGLTIVALILVERAAFSFIEVAQRCGSGLASVRKRTHRGVNAVTEAWAEARDRDRERREEERRAAEPIIASPEQADAIIAAFADDGDEGASPGFVRRAAASRRAAPPRASDRGNDAAAVEPSPVAEPAPSEPAGDSVAGSGQAESSTPTGGATVVAAAVEAPAAAPPAPTAPPAAEAGTPTPAVALSEATTPSLPVVQESGPAAGDSPDTAAGTKSQGKTARKGRRKAKTEDEPTIVDTSDEAKVTKARRRRAKRAGSEYQLPPPHLLDPPITDGWSHSPEQLKETARLLEKTLKDYGVDGKVQEIRPGPTLTTFEVSPAPGTKVSKVASLADDLALGLSRTVRIIAPIPGKNRVGFELPNDQRVPVNLRELIESQDFMSLRAPLPCVLGRNIVGRPFFADLASMPHVIVAGATGAGKSVGLNVMLISLLYRCTPDQMRLLLIDPKVVELAPFDHIPHLLFPVVTAVKQAANALKWTVDEMERRYQLFADAGVRSIVTYNRWVKRVRAGEAPPPPPPELVTAIAPDGAQLEIPACKDGSDAELPDKLPYIVVVVEEFADLMMQHGKDVEASVARLAQKARAAGIHVILTTQRPSVDVITGMIKANFPTRIAYRVSQKVDSRTILDQQGAEHLLGKGDLLVKLNGKSDVERVQCPFASEDEVQRVTDMLRSQGRPEYDDSIVRNREEDSEPADPADAENDPLYDQAVRIVADTRKCSTSWIQRKLGIGYNRAAKIVETMERNGLIGPPNGSKPRDILISSH
jgi:S-DNA-T family DNA segregation ATPase FtsK/SpoIIIE